MPRAWSKLMKRSYQSFAHVNRAKDIYISVDGKSFPPRSLSSRLDYVFGDIILLYLR